MQACMIDFLLNAYLVERSKSIDISRLKIPSVSSTTTNALLTLETIYLNIQQSMPTNTNSEQLTEELNDESDETTIVSSDNQDNSQITITVCDEAKSLKKQFPCNRTLLIREMKYFADYLKDEPDQMEEVDISVHCDLDIFQWLMSFVNRRTASKLPELEPRVAISILISSDFLKMDKLVRQSLDYIYEHLNEILATNCNVSCISENLFRQLVKKFSNPLDIEQIHDRKNRIRGKLFEFSLENLLNENKIIRCQFCLNIMTCEQMERLPCLIEHLIMKPNGKLCFQHKIDPKFDINQWIKDIHVKGENSWRNTFWIVWLHIHGDECARCHEYFRFIDFSTCSYHSKLTITDGKHDCCSQLICNFDILQSNLRPNACQQREHICQKQNLITEIYEHIDKLELMKNYPQFRTSFINPNRTNLMINKVIEQSIYGLISNSEQKKSFVHAQWTPLLDRQPFGPEIKFIWDAAKSTRWNQDTQREDEHRRYDEMLRMLLSIQQNIKSNTIRTSKETNSTSLISPGGIYCRIEYDWRTRQNSSMNNNNTNTNKNRQRFNFK